MTRTEWQQLADRWLVDAKGLLDDHHWSAAYYLDSARATDSTANQILGKNWLIAKDWNEKARYRTTSHQKAKKLYAAITDTPDGVMQWIRAPLVMDQIDAGARFLAEFQKCLPVQSAFWLKESEDGEWWLYVVSDQITDDNFDVAYGEVLRIARSAQDPWFDPFQVKLIGQDDPLAKAVADIQRGYSGRVPTRFNGKVFGNVFVDEVYIYPSPLPTPTH